MPEYANTRSGVDRRAHCGSHEDYHDTLERVVNNTEWMMKFLKLSGIIAGSFITVIVIPVAIWLVSLNTRVSVMETKLDLHVGSAVVKNVVSKK